jgi:enterochelin esterase-like enzyme
MFLQNRKNIMWSSHRKIELNKIFQRVTLMSFTLFICLLLFGCAGKNGDLRSSGFSEPLKESQVIKLSLNSNYMGRKMPCLVYLPKGYGGGKDYPVWYGLHGYSSDESMWIDNGVGEVADQLIDNGGIEPIIMAFPYTGTTTMKEIAKDMEDDGKLSESNMDQFMCRELIPYIDSHYYTVTSADGRYIGGFSMGGMISLRIAFHHTDMFSKVGGYSASVISSDYSVRQLEKWLFPYDNADKVDDITGYDKKKGFDKLNVYLDAGKVNDPFTIGLQSLYDALQKRGIKSEFQLSEGGHTLRKTSIKDYLKFYAGKNLTKK